MLYLFFCLSIVQFEQERKLQQYSSVFKVLLLTSLSWDWKLGEGLNKPEGDVNKLAKDLVWSSSGLACSLSYRLLGWQLLLETVGKAGRVDGSSLGSWLGRNGKLIRWSTVPVILLSNLCKNYCLGPTPQDDLTCIRVSKWDFWLLSEFRRKKILWRPSGNFILEEWNRHWGNVRNGI